MLVKHNLNRPFVFVCVPSSITALVQRDHADGPSESGCDGGLHEGESDFEQVPSSDPAKMAVSFPFLSIALA